MSFSKLNGVLNDMIGDDCPLFDIRVHKNYDEVFSRSYGFSDYEHRRKVDDKTMYWLYSATKLITCSSILRLVEQGKMSLDDELCKYLPEFTDMMVRQSDGSLKKAENKITIRHLFSMQGGFNYNCDCPSIRELKLSNEEATTADYIRALSNEPLDFEPGTRFQYSLCHDVLARVSEVVSGMTFGEYLQKNVFEPFEIKSITLHPVKKHYDHLAALYSRQTVLHPVSAINGFTLSGNYECGGAGLMGNATEYIRVLDALANGGVAFNGYKYLKPETIELYRTPLKDCWLEGYDYGLGVRVLTTHEFGAKAPIGEFGWDGAAGAYAMIDPENNLSIFMATHVLAHSNIQPKWHPQIRDAVYECLGLC